MRKQLVLTTAATALLLSATLTVGCSNSPTTVAQTGQNISRDNNQNAQQVDGIAAKYNGQDITEQEVSDYISQYRLYSNVESDEDWATLLDESNTTANDMRTFAIKEIATDIALKQKADELKVSLTEEEINKELETQRMLVGLTSDTDWKNVLETSRYTEESYRKDLKNELLLQRVYDRESTPIELSELQLSSFAKDNAATYTGKKVITLSFPVEQQSTGAEFASSFDDKTTAEKFRQSAEEAVGSDVASNISVAKWTCLDNVPVEIENSVADKHPGEVAVAKKADGSLDVVFIVEEYSSDRYGAPVLADMPSEIRKQLEADCRAYLRNEEITAYRTGLLKQNKLTVYDMPNGLPYDVDLALSRYGKETTAEEDDAAAQELIEKHLNELENTNNTE